MSSNGQQGGSVKALQVYLKQREPHLAQWAQGAVDPSSLIRFALLDYSHNEKLQECSPESIYVSLIAAAQLGLEPSATRGEGAIVPYKGVAQFQPMYRGLVKLARLNGPVKSIYSHVAYEGDVFAVQLGTDPKIVHELNLKKRGKPIAAYAVARIDGDDPLYEVLSWDDVAKIRALAPKSPAWRDWETEMAKKSAVKRLCKMLPVGDKFSQAARLDDMVTAGDVAGYHRVIDVEATEEKPAEKPPTRGVSGLKADLASRSRTPAPPPDAEGPDACRDCGTPIDTGDTHCEACAS